MDFGGDIILIDDNSSDNFFHRLVLEEEVGVSNEIHEFLYAQDALDYLRRSDRPPVSAIFLDINMPRMNGFEFMESYASLEDDHCADIVVFMLTTSVNPRDREKAGEFEVVRDFISKPLTKEAAIGVRETIA